jgi:hypothetical protein
MIAERPSSAASAVRPDDRQADLVVVVVAELRRLQSNRRDATYILPAFIASLCNQVIASN